MDHCGKFEVFSRGKGRNCPGTWFLTALRNMSDSALQSIILYFILSRQNIYEAVQTLGFHDMQIGGVAFKKEKKKSFLLFIYFYFVFKTGWMCFNMKTLK